MEERADYKSVKLLYDHLEQNFGVGRDDGITVDFGMGGIQSWTIVKLGGNTVLDMELTFDRVDYDLQGTCMLTIGLRWGGRYKTIKWPLFPWTGQGIPAIAIREIIVLIKEHVEDEKWRDSPWTLK